MLTILIIDRVDGQCLPSGKSPSTLTGFVYTAKKLRSDPTNSHGGKRSSFNPGFTRLKAV
jgi:hypothetical protein